MHAIHCWSEDDFNRSKLDIIDGKAKETNVVLPLATDPSQKLKNGGGGNKVVLEPRVSPAFAITYFCNHCNSIFDPTPAKTWTKGHWPLDDLWPQICWGHMCDATQGSLYHR